MSSAWVGGSSFAGGVGPPRVTVLRNPCFWRRRESERCMRERGIEVRPRRASEAFCMCEQTWARLTRDMVGAGLDALSARVVLSGGVLYGSVDSAGRDISLESMRV
jgi:hypothetical protein